MTLSPDQCYQALLAHDARFDGRFFVAVKSTRIYCRPICRAKTPLKENCRFFAYAAAAEAAGYRPCKRCRPELAPGASLMDSGSQLARRAASYIAQDFLADHSLAGLAAELGVTDRRMRQVFRDEFGVSPVEFGQTQRLLLAKQLLADTEMPVTTLAMASGFKSLRRFNALLKERYGMAPTDLRKRQKAKPSESASDFSLCLAYRPPFDWERLLRFFARRAIPHVEAVERDAYFRTISLRRHGRDFSGWMAVRHDAGKRALCVRLSSGLLPVCAPVLERIRQQFDLHADPASVNAVLGSLAKTRHGLRVPGSMDGFETAVRAILGQQVSVAAARTLAGRVACRFGVPLATPVPSLTRLFPTPQRMARAAVGEIAALGITGRRAETLIAMARAVANHTLVLEPGGRIEEVLRRLRELPGVGEWTVQYIAMRALAWPDAFPHADLGIRKALNGASPKEALEIAEAWRPWRAYATLHLWASLKDGA